jgi:K+-sensing histidine kinase KdpD
MQRGRDVEWATAALMALLALAVAGALVGVRDQLDNANVALILMTIVVTAGLLGGRVAGITVAFVSSLSFNFFHTRPYQSLRIHRGNDVVTVALLFISGLVVGEVANRRRRSRETAHSRGVELERLRDVARRVVETRPLAEVWSTVQHDLVDVLGATEVWFETPDAISAAGALPRIDANGAVESNVYRWAGTGFALPKEGVQLSVGRPSAPQGRVVLRGDVRHAVDLEDRQFALALVELLSLAIAQHPGTSLADLSPIAVPTTR